MIEVRISQQEIINIRNESLWPINYLFRLLVTDKMRKAGIPIKGYLFPDVDTRKGIITRFVDLETLEEVYQWYEKEDEK